VNNYLTAALGGERLLAKVERLDRSEKIGYSLAAAVIAMQAFAIYAGAGIWTPLVLPLLAAVPFAISTYRYQRVASYTLKPRPASMTVAALALFAACLFIFAPAEPSLKFQIFRMIVLDLTILLAAGLLAALLYIRRSGAT